MRLRARWQLSGFGWRVAILWLISGLSNLALQSPAWFALVKSRLVFLFPGLAIGETGYLAFILVSLLTGLALTLLVLVVVWLENPASIRNFLKIGPVDWRGIGLIALLTALLNVMEAAFLRRLVYEPVRLALISIGLRGSPATEISFTPDPSLAGLNILLLVLILWIEAPEELFFRGYVQNHLQERIGVGLALIAGSFIWAVWHLFDIADVFRILIYGLAYSLVFRLRQNTTPLAIWHPLGNRLLLLASILSALPR